MTAMERPEPTLVPQWLKTSAGTSCTSNSNSNSSINSNQHFGSSARLDDRASGNFSRNRSSCSATDNATTRSASSIDRTSSSNSRRSTSTNGSLSRDKDSFSHIKSYSNFRRKHPDREWERDYGYHGKERPLANEYDDNFDPFAASMSDIGTLQRSQSMIARKQTESWPKKIGSNMNNGAFSNASSKVSSVSSTSNTSFEREFPSLGSEEKQNPADIKRVSSPGLNVVSSSPFLGSSAVIGGDGWTSALAEVPAIAVGNGTMLPSIHQSTSVSCVSSVSSTTNGLNMAETLAQAPLRARTAPEISVEAQRLEELAIRQSRQLIPVTPSIPKASALSSSEKLKAKGVKSVDIGVLPKGVVQPSTQLLNPTLRGPSKDAPKASQGGNLQVLNREKSGLSITAKEIQIPTNASRSMNTLGILPSVLTSLKNHSTPKLRTETKPSVISMVPSSVLEKKPSPNAQNRNEFFNSLRKKTAIDHSTATQEQDSVLPSEASDEKATVFAASDCQVEDYSVPESGLDHPVTGGGGVSGSCNGFEQSETSKQEEDGQDSSCLDELDVTPAGEEYIFLKQLGWNEHEEVEFITEEEKKRFYSEHNINKEPSSELYHPDSHSQQQILVTEGHASLA